MSQAMATTRSNVAEIPPRRSRGTFSRGRWQRFCFRTASMHASQLFGQLGRMNPGFAVHSSAFAHIAQFSFWSRQSSFARRRFAAPFAIRLRNDSTLFAVCTAAAAVAAARSEVAAAVAFAACIALALTELTAVARLFASLFGDALVAPGSNARAESSVSSTMDRCKAAAEMRKMNAAKIRRPAHVRILIVALLPGRFLGGVAPGSMPSRVHPDAERLGWTHMMCSV